jgi:hypothetical protein
MPFINWRAFGVNANLTGLRSASRRECSHRAQEVATEINLVQSSLLTSAMVDWVG